MLKIDSCMQTMLLKRRPVFATIPQVALTTGKGTIRLGAFLPNIPTPGGFSNNPGMASIKLERIEFQFQAVMSFSCYRYRRGLFSHFNILSPYVHCRRKHSY